MVAPQQGIAFDAAKLNGTDLKFAVVRTRWNSQITEPLLNDVKKALVDAGVDPENIFETDVPGSWELPMVTKYLAFSQKFDGVIPIGCLVKGETYHFEYIAGAASDALMQVQQSSGVPVTFGILTVETLDQAMERADGEKSHGYSWGQTAVEMALLRRWASGRKSTKMGFGVSPESAVAASLAEWEGKKTDKAKYLF
uniref:6,7-dimethyl-8-ribityllumazine synthase n=1 Tax=Chromera velia CCMP2878 TaxID=1169474 RepID=A0A0G4FFI5_9ALVE|eukprot:Cvel_16716.t1-p1 / transcript=Cvel_16716.t1 / gene=Cvel_16716 / organism=Chromera_velia_CCMP2878 / gene_product=6,7-dimethyl-8-ribityllumazine synthase, putative / transcript_product=6,7-dimethyl-8-ribityllumazine synthase, putative / location=Cvel_scaffold1299:12967-15422(+) / protein_length=196 / sequence_SO=supercontig / SO=protein_coding / is_pseudo=false